MLNLHAISCARGDRLILSGVSLGLDSGGLIVLRGPNGCGKSTLLRTIAGLQQPVAGRMEVDPDDVAYSGHLDAIKPTLSVAENLQFWADVYGTQSIDPSMTAFDLAGLKARMANTLSAGQKRRLGLARLVATGRKFWVMDEPTVSLDAANIALFEKVVKSHLSNGGAAIMATHQEFGIKANVIDVAQFAPKVTAHQSAFDEALA